MSLYAQRRSIQKIQELFNRFRLGDRNDGGKCNRKELIYLSTYKPIYFKAAFTLAEILITLGIIGVVAAMTIPALMTKIKNHQIEAILKEDYSILQQMMISANEEGAISSLPVSNDINLIRSWFETYMLPYIKAARVCYDEQGCWAANRVKKLNGVDFNSTSGIGCGYKSVGMVLNNGSFVCLDDYGSSTMKAQFGISTKAYVSLIFYIDTNGIKPPNVFGKDIYILGFKEELGRLVPAGTDTTNAEQVKDCSKTGTGFFCLSLVKNRGWKLVDIK